MSSFTTVNSGATAWKGDKHIVALGANYVSSSLHKWVQKMLTHCTSGAEDSLNGCLLAKYPDSGILAYKYPSRLKTEMEACKYF